MANQQQVVSEEVQQLLLSELRKHMAPMNIVAIRTEQYASDWEDGPDLWVYARYLGDKVKWGGRKFFLLIRALRPKLREIGETRYPIILFERIKEAENAVA